MADDDADEFRRDVREALAVAGQPVDPSLDIARRVLKWLQSAEVEISPADETLDAEDATGDDPTASESSDVADATTDENSA